MKITIDINDSLIANAKGLAVQQHTSLTRLIEEGLQLRLQSLQATAKANERKHSRKIPVFNGRGGMLDGINPASNKAMLNAVEMAPDIKVLVAASRNVILTLKQSE